MNEFLTSNTLDPSKPVQTRDGRAVRIISIDGPFDRPIVGVIDGNGGANCWTKAGRLGQDDDYESNADLVNVPEPAAPAPTQACPTRNDAICAARADMPEQIGGAWVDHAIRSYERTLSIGQRVEKIGGNFQWPGKIAGAYFSTSGELHYVVECVVPGVAGAQHIYTPKQLRILADDEDYGFLKTAAAELEKLKVASK